MGLGMTPVAPRRPSSFRTSLTGEDLTSQMEPFDDFNHFSDEDLTRVTREWRAKADRGERDAFGIAHECEVELRRRQRAKEVVSPAPAETAVTAAQEPWWKFWGRGTARRQDGSGSAL